MRVRHFCGAHVYRATVGRTFGRSRGPGFDVHRVALQRDLTTIGCLFNNLRCFSRAAVGRQPTVSTNRTGLIDRVTPQADLAPRGADGAGRDRARVVNHRRL